MEINDLFQEVDDVHNVVSGAWKWECDMFPVPRFEISCPQCNCPDIQLSNISYGTREDSNHKYRAEPSYKCIRCSFFWTHGIVCPEDVFEKATWGGRWNFTHGPKSVWRWREVRDYVRGRECPPTLHNKPSSG